MIEITDEVMQKLKNHIDNYRFTTGQYDPDKIPDIYKVPVVGFLCVKQHYSNNNNLVCLKPLMPTDDSGEFDYSLLKGEEIVDVLPSNMRVYKVFGIYAADVTPDQVLNDSFGDMTTVELGYEIEGFEPPNWEAKLKKAWLHSIIGYVSRLNENENEKKED